MRVGARARVRQLLPPRRRATPTAVLAPYDRAAFAANIAEELIEIGVRCVIAAGWAVDDEPAEKFATTFYAALLGGGALHRRRGRGAQRRLARTPRRQHLGGVPVLRRPGLDLAPRGRRRAARRRRRRGDEFAGVASPLSLALALETSDLARLRQRRYGARAERRAARSCDKVRYLEAQFAPLWGGMGAVAEAFGLAYADASEVDKAIDWYRARGRRAATAARRSRPPSNSATCWCGAARARTDPAARASGHRGRHRAARAARRGAVDDRAREPARLGVQAAHDGRVASRPQARCRRRTAIRPSSTTGMPRAWRARPAPTTCSTRRRTASAASCAPRSWRSAPVGSPKSACARCANRCRRRPATNRTSGRWSGRPSLLHPRGTVAPASSPTRGAGAGRQACAS